MYSTKLGWLSVIFFCATQHKTKISFRAQVGLLAPSWHCCRGRTFLLQPKYFSSDCAFISNALQVKRCGLETDLHHFQVVDLCKNPGLSLSHDLEVGRKIPVLSVSRDICVEYIWSCEGDWSIGKSWLWMLITKCLEKELKEREIPIHLNFYYASKPSLSEVSMA